MIPHIMSPVLPESQKKTTGFAQKSGHPLGPEIACDLTN